MALTYPQIDPVAFAVGPLQVHWYGLMYLAAFAGAWLLALQRSQRAWSPVRRQKVEDLVVYVAFGVIIGGRCGYVLFYNFEKWLSDPIWLIRLWEGGMSFHGGLLGVMLAMLIFARHINQPFLAVADFVARLEASPHPGARGTIFCSIPSKLRYPFSLAPCPSEREWVDRGSHSVGPPQP